MRELGSNEMLKQTFSSTLHSNMPDITSLNLLDQESAPKNKLNAPSSPMGTLKKVCPQSLQKLSTVPLVKNTGRIEREKTPPGFPDSVYSQAAAIFQKTHVKKDHAHRLIRYGPGDVDDYSGIIADVDANTKQNEHWAYDLAFNALRYQDLLEDILIDSLFYRSQQMPDDLMALVVVLLYDLMDRKFNPREPKIRAGEGLIKEVRQVEDRLHRYKTKLEASLAHCRIKQNFLTLDNFLPPTVREKHLRRRTIPLYAWVNTLKASIKSVSEILRTAGFTQLDSHAQLVGNVFCKDTHCSDVLLFPRSVQKQLEKSKLVTEHTLMIQDKSRSLVACAVRQLLAEKCDVLMVGSFSALTVAHVAVQAAACSGCVHVCGVFNPIFQEELQMTFLSIGCTNIKLLSDDFNELNEWDSRIQKVQVIVVVPQCSVSALCNPVEFILNENGDRGLLHGLSKGSISDYKLEALVAKQTQYLSHALTFSKVKAVVYCTCSVFPEENEQLVKKVLERADSKPKALPFRLVSAGWGHEEEKFFKTEASDFTDGCFLCVVKREPDPAEVETVQDILARAAAKGLLGGLMSLDPMSGEKPKKKRKQKGPQLAPPSTQIEPITFTNNSLNPDDTVLATTVSQTATIPYHTSTTQSPTNLDQNSLIMDGTFSKRLDALHQQFDDQTSSSNKHSKRHRLRSKAPKQSKKRKTSKSSTSKEHKSRTQPPSKKLLHLRPSQQASPLSKQSGVRVPASPYTSKHLHSRAKSQPDLLSSQEVLNPKEKHYLPPVYQHSPAHLSSSLHRMLSSTSSNFSSSLSSSSSIDKNSVVSQAWR